MRDPTALAFEQLLCSISACVIFMTLCCLYFYFSNSSYLILLPVPGGILKTAVPLTVYECVLHAPGIEYDLACELVCILY